MPRFLGLDCGGSACRAIAVDESGRVLFHGHAGPANLATTPMRLLRENLQRATSEAPTPNSVCGCFAGLLTQEDLRRALDVLTELFPSATLFAAPDYAAAHMANEEHADFTVIAGTGAIVCSRIDGRFVKSGGRGYLLGDYGSTYRYGRAAMQRFLDVGQRGCSQSLTADVLRWFGSVEPNEALARLYRSRAPVSLLAKLVRAFRSDAEAGERYALDFLDQESGRLADTVARHVTEHLPSEGPLAGCIGGGLWGASALFRETFERALHERLSGRELTVSRLRTPPVYGAVRMAREHYDEHRS